MITKRLLITLSIFSFCAIGTFNIFYFPNKNNKPHIPTKPTSAAEPYPDHVPKSVIDMEAMFRLNPQTHVYEAEGKPIIWHYWDDDDMPLYVRLLAEATQCRNPEFRVIIVHNSTIRDYLPNMKERNFSTAFGYLIAPHKADIFRSSILYKYGGVYADVDSFAYDRLYPYYRSLSTYDTFTADWGKIKIAQGQIGPIRAGLPVYYELVQEQKARVLQLYHNGTLNIKSSKKNYPVKWGDFMNMSNVLMKREIESNRMNYRGYEGAFTVGQLVNKGLAGAPMIPFANVSAKVLPVKKTPFIFLHNSRIKPPIKQYKTVEGLFSVDGEPTMFGVFVGCALVGCMGQMESQLYRDDNAVTSLTGLNVTELLDSMYALNMTLCHMVEGRPVD